jgi:hypothetical protein
MLVTKNGNRCARFPERLDHPAEQFVARVKVLAFFVVRVIPVLADNHDSLYGEFSVFDQCVPDSIPDGYLILSGHGAAQVIRGDLIGIQGDHADARGAVNSVIIIPFEETSHDDIGMGIQTVFGYYGGNSLSFVLRRGGNRTGLRGAGESDPCCGSPK